MHRALLPVHPPQKGFTLRDDERGNSNQTLSRQGKIRGPAHTEARPFQLLPQLRHTDARLTLQNGMQDLRLLPELQRLLLKNIYRRRHGEDL